MWQTADVTADSQQSRCMILRERCTRRWPCKCRSRRGLSDSKSSQPLIDSNVADRLTLVDNVKVFKVMLVTTQDVFDVGLEDLLQPGGVGNAGHV